MNERACESVGIDLGTTYSSLAYMDAQMIPRIVSDSSGQAVMPSIVFFADDDIIVGDMALQHAKLSADRVVQFVKVHVGDRWRKTILGREHTPESISAIILGQLVKEAEPQIGPIRKAVITVPAYFTERRRRATQQAGEIAGLEVIGTLNEPMAATIAYGLHREGGEQLALVYDLGGGTFDVTIVRISANELEELATSGNRQLGGRDWDQALVDYVVEDFARANNFSLEDDPQAMQDLVLEAERAKRRLGRMNKTSIRVHCQGRDHHLEITRDQFEDLTAPLLQATKLTAESALRDAQLTWGQLSRVVLVGGSTHMPMVRTMLKQASGKQPDTGVNPVVAVALGAAAYAHMLESGVGPKAIEHMASEELEPEPSGQQEIDAERMGHPSPPPLPQEAPGRPAVRFVTAHGVGVKVRRTDGFSNRVLIPKNTQVPASVTKRFLTKSVGAGGRRIKVDITQGDTPDLDLAEHLGTGIIHGLPPNEPDGQAVDVTMEFDEQGRLHVRAVYVPRQQDMNMLLEIPTGLQEEEVQEHRQYLEDTGFFASAHEADLLAPIDDDDDDDDGLDDIPVLEPL